MELVVQSEGEPGFKIPVLDGTEGPGGAPVYVLGKGSWVWVGVPDQEQKSQGRTEFLALLRGAEPLDLNGNHRQDSERQVTD